MGTFKCLKIHYLTANSVAVFEMLCIKAEGFKPSVSQCWRQVSFAAHERRI